MGNKRKVKRVKAFVAISPEVEGSKIYMPHGDFTIYESIEHAEDCGWIRTKDRIVPCTITYTVPERGKK